MKSTLASAELSLLISRLGIQQGPTREPVPSEWNLGLLAGRFAELSSAGETACVSAAISIVLEAQHRGEPAVWVAVGSSTFFPPDVAASGVDLYSLPVIQVKNALQAARTADWLLRSGAFAIVVLDLGHDCELRIPVQSRLVGLAKKHHSALLCLTKKRSEAPSIGSLVSIRGEAGVRKTGFDRFTWEVQILKDKRRGPGWSYEDECRGVEGLC
ncbi:MAG: recombinase A [Candidatus Latescibacterota bacterium]|nr:MAG: recombinase A [Candidatus Latescibacterota bacterium]